MNERNYNYDIIRMTAIVFVILIHSCGLLMENLEIRSVQLMQIGLTSLVNTAVPLFVMLSGALLLGKEEPLGVFVRKRLSRILLPFVIWSFILYLAQHPPRSAAFLWEYPLALLTGGVHEVYLYVYMIILLYLLTPVLRPAMRDRATGLWTGGVILGLFLLYFLFPDIPYVKNAGFENIRFLLSYVGGFLLVRHLSGKRWLGWAGLAVAVAGYAVNFLTGLYHPVPIPVYVFTAFGLFAWILSWKPRKPLAVVTFLSETSYGIYLCHVAVISLFVRLAGAYIPVLASPFVTGSVTLLTCGLMMWLCKKCRLKKILY